MEELKERLKIAFSRAPSKRAVAAACGVSDQAITGWQKTGKMDHAHMPAIAKVCRVRLQWLMTGEGQKEINSLEDLALVHNPTNDPNGSIYRQDIYVPSKGYLTSDDIELLARRVTKVPLISWVQAGAWCESPDNFSPGDAEDWLDCSFPHSSGTYCLRVVGQSMFPDYREGEIIFVDPEIEALHGDDVVVRTPDNKHTFKRLQITPDGTYLLAVNPDHPERMIKIPDETRICGVVIASQQSRRIKNR